jgi:hypothetical protein
MNSQGNRLDLIKKTLSYDPSSGAITWINDRVAGRWRNFVKCKAGDVASHPVKTGYLAVNCVGLRVQAHVAAWVLHYGEWPSGEVDHINGVRNDNRIKNLRLATHTQNAQNQKKKKNNTSGWKGVFLHRSSGLWNARIRINGKEKSLGYFRDVREAAEEYMFAALEHHGEFARFE